MMRPDLQNDATYKRLLCEIVLDVFVCKNKS
jgi:hypothetical protein